MAVLNEAGEQVAFCNTWQAAAAIDPCEQEQERGGVEQEEMRG